MWRQPPFDSIRFMGKNFAVDPHDEPSLGFCHFDHCKITYRPDQSPQQLQETVLHEAIHVIDFALELKLRHKQVQGLGAGIHSLVRDNPEFSAWLLNDYAKK